MLNFSSLNRPQYIQQLREASFDVLIIGGGITGAGIALDACSRGLKVALIDMNDFASGTSSKSTKLIHGGLRYLKQLEFQLVAEVGKERKIIHRIAPHLTRPEPMLLPLVTNGSLSKFSARLGMWVYEKLAGVDKKEWHKNLSVDETKKIEPLLNTEGLKGGILFYEYRTDDARLTIEVMKEAVSRGTIALNYLKATSFLYKNKHISGANVVDQLSGEIFEINASYVINASGPWVDKLTAFETIHTENKLQITKGVHLVVDWKKLPLKQSMYFDTYDHRMLFVIPREGKTYIGTTDTFYKDDMTRPTITMEDRDYLLKCVTDFFPQNPIYANDIESAWAGLRPLISKPSKGPSEISRKDEVFESSSGLLTIAGGKLTGYRKMAQRIVDIVTTKIQQHEHKKIAPCITSTINLSGGKLKSNETFHDFFQQQLKYGLSIGLTKEETETLLYRYGTNITKVFSLYETLKPETHQLPLLLRAQIIYSVKNEMCVSLSDFLIRRTGSLYFNIELVKQWKDDVSTYMQSILSWSDSLKNQFDIELKTTLDEIEAISNHSTK